MSKKRRMYGFSLLEDVADRFDILVKESHLNRTAYFTTIIDEKYNSLLKEKVKSASSSSEEKIFFPGYGWMPKQFVQDIMQENP